MCTCLIPHVSEDADPTRRSGFYVIRYTHGNLLAAPPEALVNVVNKVGVMGKGIASMFRESFPVLPGSLWPRRATCT